MPALASFKHTSFFSFFTSRLSFINLAPWWKRFLIFELNTTQALSVTIYTVVSLRLLPQLKMYLILSTPLTCWKDLCGPQWSGDRILVPRNIYEYVISFDCSRGKPMASDWWFQEPLLAKFPMIYHTKILQFRKRLMVPQMRSPYLSQYIIPSQ